MVQDTFAASIYRLGVFQFNTALMSTTLQAYFDRILAAIIFAKEQPNILSLW